MTEVLKRKKYGKLFFVFVIFLRNTIIFYNIFYIGKFRSVKKKRLDHPEIFTFRQNERYSNLTSAYFLIVSLVSGIA